MDLNHIELPNNVVADLYSSSLVETGEIAAKPIAEKKAVEITTPSPVWKWLGENKKNILVIVNYDNTVHLPDDELQLLTNMLMACKLSLADVAIINLQNQPHQTYKEILDQFKTRIALLFGIEPAILGLPMNFPFFQIQPFANCSFLYAPSLKELEEDKIHKSKLWVTLRRLFGI
ncbi:MAG TPA: hypothetical protein VF487_02895 [Chitinophagaceae bacterium]